MQSEDLIVSHAGIHGFLLGDLSILVSIKLLHHRFSKCFTIPFSLHQFTHCSNIPFHFFGIYEAIFIFIVSLEPPFDLILRSLVAHDSHEKHKLFQADHTVPVSVKSIEQSLKILRCSHDSKLCDHAEELALVQVTHLTILPLLYSSLGVSTVCKVQPVKSCFSSLSPTRVLDMLHQELHVLGRDLVLGGLVAHLLFLLLNACTRWRRFVKLPSM